MIEHNYIHHCGPRVNARDPRCARARSFCWEPCCGTWRLRRLAPAALGTCGAWHLRRLAPAALSACDATCEAWRLRRFAPAVLGACGAWHMRRLAPAAFSACGAWRLRRLAPAALGAWRLRCIRACKIRIIEDFELTSLKLQVFEF